MCVTHRESLSCLDFRKFIFSAKLDSVLILLFFAILVSQIGCRKTPETSNFEIELETSLPSASHRIEIPIRNPLSESARLIGFRASCACSNPSFSECEIDGLSTAKVFVALDTFRIRQSFPNVGGSVSLLPKLQAADGRIVDGVPIMFQIVQSHSMRSIPNSLYFSDEDTRELRILASGAVKGLRFDDLQCGFTVHETTQREASEKSGDGEWTLAIRGRVGKDIPSEPNQQIRVFGIDKNGVLISGVTIPVAFVSPQEAFLSQDTIRIGSQRTDFTSIVHGSVTDVRVDVSKDFSNDIQVEDIRFDSQNRVLHFAILPLREFSGQQAVVSAALFDREKLLATVSVFVFCTAVTNEGREGSGEMNP